MNAEVAESHQQSMLAWVFHALGVPYVLLLPLVAVLSFGLTALIIWRGKNTAAWVATVFTVSMPALVGVFAAVQGMIASYSVIAASNSTPKASEVAAGISMALVGLFVGLLLMAPSFGLAILGLCIRGFQSDPSYLPEKRL